MVAAETLRSDLCNWDTCYVSGRLHKPVQILQADAPLMQAHESNLQSALAAGILLLPPRFTLQVRCWAGCVCKHGPYSLGVKQKCTAARAALKAVCCDAQHSSLIGTCGLQELLAAVVGLSYTGDVRMGFAEDSRKVERIVAGSFDGLSSLYLPRLRVIIAMCITRLACTAQGCSTAPFSKQHTGARGWCTFQIAYQSGIDLAAVQSCLAAGFPQSACKPLLRVQDGPLGQVASMCSKTQLGMKSMDRAVLAKAVHLLPSVRILLAEASAALQVLSSLCCILCAVGPCLQQVRICELQRRSAAIDAVAHGSACTGLCTPAQSRMATFKLAMKSSSI